MNKRKEILDVFQQAQGESYIGEDVSQLEHALQSAFFARKAGHSNDVIIASLFHDIGHFISDKDEEKMADLGVLHHEDIAAKQIIDWGFSEKIATLIRNHVDAKRYLAAHNNNYYSKLSNASKRTLEFQGGLMSQDEMLRFEKSPYFKESIQVRTNDEKAKVPGLVVPGLDSYESLLEEHLQKYALSD
jgi:predicted HD phosphohydrolase